MAVAYRRLCCAKCGAIFFGGGAQARRAAMGRPVYDKEECRLAPEAFRQLSAKRREAAMTRWNAHHKKNIDLSK